MNEFTSIVKARIIEISFFSVLIFGTIKLSGFLLVELFKLISFF